MEAAASASSRLRPSASPLRTVITASKWRRVQFPGTGGSPTAVVSAVDTSATSGMPTATSR